MAARENQGLQIALIIFVILTMILAVTTYLFFHNLQEEQMKVKANDEAVKKANKTTELAQADVQKLKKMLGFAPETELGTIQQTFATDMGKFFGTATAIKGVKYSTGTIGAEKGEVTLANGDWPTTVDGGILIVGGNSYLIDKRVDATKLALEDSSVTVPAGSAYAVINSDDMNYHFLLPFYVQELVKKTGEVVDSKDNYTKVNGELALVTTANQGEVKTYHDNAEKVAADLKGEIEKFDAGRRAVNAARDQLAAAKDKAEKALNDAVDAARKKLDEAAGLYAKLKEEFTKLADKTKKSNQPDFEIAQGKVVWINQSARTVNINLGQQDGLRKQITFGVYDGNTTNINKSQKKGSLEVIQLDGPHSAVTRIIEDDFKNPIMPNDVIYTPVWQPGHAEHFAMAGFFDIDGDGKSDRQRMHDMVIANGGVVDAEMDEKGDVTGSMDINTKYIIIGERPTDKSDKKMLDNYTKMIAKATDLGVTQIPLHKFLAYVGYTPEKAGASRGSGGAGSFAPSDKKDDFRPRTPPTKGAAGGAFDK